MEEYEIAGLQAKEATEAFIMALNGIFFVTRKAGQQPRPQDIEKAKRQIQTASYIYINNLKEVVIKYNDEARKPQVILDELLLITARLIKSANRAVQFGSPSKVSYLLGSSAHGAQGELIKRKMAQVELSVNYADRVWRNPEGLVAALVRQHVKGVK